jgi:hypothetical protein
MLEISLKLEIGERTVEGLLPEYLLPIQMGLEEKFGQHTEKDEEQTFRD